MIFVGNRKVRREGKGSIPFPYPYQGMHPFRVRGDEEGCLTSAL